MGSTATVSSRGRGRLALGLRRMVDLILYSVDTKDFQATAAAVLDSSGSVFRCLPVEDSCWWVPTIVRGKQCVGASALRPNEFAQALDKLILLGSRNLPPDTPPAFPFCS